jgi:hypothetical protein
MSSFYAVGGVQFMNFKNINVKLNGNSLPELNNIQFYYGIGGSTHFEKVLFGGEGYQFYTDETEKGNNQLKSQGGLGYLYVGYKVIEKEKFYITPRVGLGGGGIQIQINSKTTETLDNFLLTNHSNNLSVGNLLFHSGFKFGFVIGKNTDFNFDLGYNYGFGNDWNVDNGNLSESVSDRIGGFFSQLSIAYRFE